MTNPTTAMGTSPVTYSDEDGALRSSTAAMPPQEGLSPEAGSQAKPAAANAGLTQLAREIAADTVFRIHSESAAHDAENTAAFCQYMREGAYDDDVTVQSALTALIHGAAAREALSKAATRFDHCADMIAESFSASGTLRAERTIKARHYALEARAIAEAV